MTIHTLELTCQLSRSEYQQIQERLKKNYPDGWEKAGKAKKSFHCFGMCENGIDIIEHRKEEKGCTFYYINYIVNPVRVITCGDYIDVWDPDAYEDLIKQFNRKLTEACEVLPFFDRCDFHRIDFCMNVRLEDQDAVRSYIRLCQRANVPGRMKLCTVYDSVGHRQAPRNNEAAMANDAFEISIYDKHAQMEEQDYDYPDGQKEHAKGVVRIELRLKKKKIREYIKKYKINTNEDFFGNTDKIANDLAKKYLHKIAGEGRMYPLRDAKERIGKSALKKKQKQQLIGFLETVSKKRSVPDAVSEYGDKKSKKLLAQLDELKIGYMPIPKDVVKYLPEKSIQTPYQFFKESC